MLRKTLPFLALIVLAVLAAGCNETPRATSSLSQPTGIVLRGTVYTAIFNGVTFIVQDPVAGAHVRLEGESGTWSAVTNANGEYVFEGIPDGNYSLVATGEGYLSIPASSSQITIKPAPDIPADNTVMTHDILLYAFAYITSYSPQPGAIVSNDQKFTVTFNAPMDISSVRFSLVPRGIRVSAAEGDTVQVNQSWSLGNSMVTIEPQGNLISNEVYELLLDCRTFLGVPPYYPFDAQGNLFLSGVGYSGSPLLDILNHFATYETSAGGVPGAPSNLQVTINGKTTSEVDYSDVISGTNDVDLYWDPSSSGNVTGYRVYVAQTGSLNNYALLGDAAANTWTTDNYFDSEIIKVLDVFHAMSGIDPIATGNYPFINNTIYFKVVAFNGDGESDGPVISAKDVKGPQARPGPFPPSFYKAGFTGATLANNYYLAPIGAAETDRVYVNFNEPIDPASIAAGNFSLDGGLNVVSATFLTNCFTGISLNWNGLVEIVASGDLTGRTLTVTSGVKDLAGNGVATGTGDTFGPF